MLLAQLAVTFGQTVNDLIKNRIMLHTTIRVNLSLVSDFLGKLMRLPIAFFDSKRIGDLIQRISDFTHIQYFLTSVLISLIMAVVTLLVYGIFIVRYNYLIFIVFIIFIGNVNLEDLSKRSWRKNCGIVMQEGFIFSDTIANNIAMSDENIEMQKIVNASKLSNLEDFVSSLPMGYEHQIGMEGNGISSGQKQRILIARAIYKNPRYIFLDEATSALDAENEHKIHDNLQGFFKGKTVLIIAHRLSTVKNAGKIIVLKEGRVVEQGTHTQLVEMKGEYFNLVKNQLELGT